MRTSKRMICHYFERRGGYDGHGRTDAPVRLAALAQWHSTPSTPTP